MAAVILCFPKKVGYVAAAAFALSSDLRGRGTSSSSLFVPPPLPGDDEEEEEDGFD